MKTYFTSVLVLALIAGAQPARAARLKELVAVEGFRGNSLTGVGIVVGLAGTGDDPSSFMAKRPLATILKHLGTTIEASEIKSKNVAIVLVTATLPPFSRTGVAFDVNVSSAGTAKSLQGGTLIATSLKGVDRETYAIANGQLLLGGWEASSQYSGSLERRNHQTTARIPGGGIVEREVPQTLPEKELVLHLKKPDFTTAARITQSINRGIGENSARVRDPGAVIVSIAPAWSNKVVELVAAIEALDATPDMPARVVIDERTGTIVVGANVVLGPAAIAYGALSIKIKEGFPVSQPAPFSNGRTVITPESDIAVAEGTGELRAVAEAATVADVAKALNTLGVRPRDLIPIFQALKAAGSLRAEIEVL